MIPASHSCPTAESSEAEPCQKELKSPGLPSTYSHKAGNSAKAANVSCGKCAKCASGRTRCPIFRHEELVGRWQDVPGLLLNPTVQRPLRMVSTAGGQSRHLRWPRLRSCRAIRVQPIYGQCPIAHILQMQLPNAGQVALLVPNHCSASTCMHYVIRACAQDICGACGRGRKCVCVSVFVCVRFACVAYFRIQAHGRLHRCT